MHGYKWPINCTRTRMPAATHLRGLDDCIARVSQGQCRQRPSDREFGKQMRGPGKVC